MRQDEEGNTWVLQDWPRASWTRKSRGDPEEVRLPKDMPPPPELIWEDPGKQRNHERYLFGPRRPVKLHEPEWAVSKWAIRKRSFLPGTGQVYLWLSEPQEDLWRRQIPCEYCGVGIGQPCVGRSIRWGKVDEQGLPVCRQSVAPYHHQYRMRASNDLAARVPWEVLPDWIWWAFHAIGQDEHALAIALSNVRGVEFTERYIESCWLPELKRQRKLGLQESEG